MTKFLKDMRGQNLPPPLGVNDGLTPDYPLVLPARDGAMDVRYADAVRKLIGLDSSTEDGELLAVRADGALILDSKAHVLQSTGQTDAKQGTQETLSSPTERDTILQLGAGNDPYNPNDAWLFHHVRNTQDPNGFYLRRKTASTLRDMLAFAEDGTKVTVGNANDATDVDFVAKKWLLRGASPDDGQVPTYNASSGEMAWANAAGSAPLTLADLHMLPFSACSIAHAANAHNATYGGIICLHVPHGGTINRISFYASAGTQVELIYIYQLASGSAYEGGTIPMIVGNSIQVSGAGFYSMTIADTVIKPGFIWVGSTAMGASNTVYSWQPSAYSPFSSQPGTKIRYIGSVSPGGNLPYPLYPTNIINTVQYPAYVRLWHT